MTETRRKRKATRKDRERKCERNKSETKKEKRDDELSVNCSAAKEQNEQPEVTNRTRKG